MLILASTSPIRKALLTKAGIAVETRAPGVNERQIENASAVDRMNAAATALLLAEHKALAVPGETVVGCDQVLELDGAILHKAANLDGARERLDQLRGRTHHLHSAVALAVDGKIVFRHVEPSALTMRAFTDAERDAVLAAEGPDVIGSVGCYRLEGPSIRLFEKIEGDYFAILGLPLLPLIAALRHFAPHVLERFT